MRITIFAVAEVMASDLVGIGAGCWAGCCCGWRFGPGFDEVWASIIFVMGLGMRVASLGWVVDIELDADVEGPLKGRNVSSDGNLDCGGGPKGGGRLDSLADCRPAESFEMLEPG